MIRFHKNEKKNIWIEVSERDGGSFTINSATFEVLNDSDVIVQASSSATIDGAKVYGLVDTTASGFTQGNSYKVKFSYIIGSETYINIVSIKLEETRL